MTMSIVSLRPSLRRPRQWLHENVRERVVQRLAGLQHGRLVIEDRDERIVLGVVEDAPKHARIEVRDARFWQEVAANGSLGAAEAYIMGWWKSPDLVAVIRLFAANRQWLRRFDSAWRSPAAWLRRCYALWYRHSRESARNAIAAHYDIGNELFATFLDESMNYSSAYFGDGCNSLHQASVAKMDLICRKLDLQPGDRVLEIGCGWGALSVYMAEHYGCEVTATTISQEQYTVACDRVREAGLTDQVQIVLEDFRDLDGQYDKLVSVEMIEAIGHRHYETFFRSCERLLRDDGRALIQAITIPDQEFARARGEADFIRRYIFPGSCIPSLGALQQAAGKASDCRLVDVHDMTPHYAKTLAAWREVFCARSAEVAELGYDADFQRMWHYYLAYCEGGFAEHAIGVHQILWARPAWRGQETGVPR